MDKFEILAVNRAGFLDLRHIKGRSFEILADVEFSIVWFDSHRKARQTFINIQEGFRTDFASTPPPFPSITVGADAYVLHDWGYRKNRPPFSKAFWDEAMRVRLVQQGFPGYRARARWLGLKTPISTFIWNKHRSKDNVHNENV